MQQTIVYKKSPGQERTSKHCIECAILLQTYRLLSYERYSNDRVFILMTIFFAGQKYVKKNENVTCTLTFRESDYLDKNNSVFCVLSSHRRNRHVAGNRNLILRKDQKRFRRIIVAARCK